MINQQPSKRTLEQLHDLERDYANGARTIATDTLKMLFLINGGAVVVIMGMIGNFARGSRPVDVRDAATAVSLFGVAVVLLGIAAASGWASERLNAEAYQNRRLYGGDNGADTVSVILGMLMAVLVSMSLFATLVAMRTSMDAIVTLSFALAKAPA